MTDVAKAEDLTHCYCGKELDPNKNGCSCGLSREQSRQKFINLSREANRIMFPDMPEYLLDRPWGNK